MGQALSKWLFLIVLVLLAVFYVYLAGWY